MPQVPEHLQCMTSDPRTDAARATSCHNGVVHILLQHVQPEETSIAHVFLDGLAGRVKKAEASKLVYLYTATASDMAALQLCVLTGLLRGVQNNLHSRLSFEVAKGHGHKSGSRAK